MSRKKRNPAEEAAYKEGAAVGYVQAKKIVEDKFQVKGPKSVVGGSRKQDFKDTVERAAEKPFWRRWWPEGD